MCQDCIDADKAACFDAYDLTDITDLEYHQFLRSSGFDGLKTLDYVTYMAWIRARQLAPNRQASDDTDAWVYRDNNNNCNWGSISMGDPRETWDTWNP
ncbi:hypothetical protein Q8F55_003241 [Vanrija albida]|uniref:Uncharacterized protein n=1 Tax=Vanrija albida TaxID=181172 RepID=A0ABR3QBY5_9TREE